VGIHDFSTKGRDNEAPYEPEEGLLNRSQLVKAVAAHTGNDAKAVDATMKGLTEVVTAITSKGEPVTIAGFAKFARVETKARMGRNPATGAPVKIKAKKKARITALKGFKEAVLTPSMAPKLAKGVWPPAAGPAKPAIKAAGTRAAGTAAARTRAAATADASAARASATRPSATRPSPASASAASASSAKPSSAKPSSAKPSSAKPSAARAPGTKAAGARRTSTTRTTAANGASANGASANGATPRRGPTKRAAAR